MESKRKVFGIGFHKTGTKTLGDCLVTLGYRHQSYSSHLMTSLREGKLEEIWQASAQNESFEDWPWPIVYPELLERYPEARFILTIRKDSQTWFKSLLGHAQRTGPTQDRAWVYGHEMPHAHEALHIKRYEDHQKEVLAFFRSKNALSQLLVCCWETGDAWKKLCDFLGHPVPESSFPHAYRGSRS